MKTIITKIRLFLKSIIEEVNTYEVQIYISSDLLRTIRMHYIPRVGDNIKYREGSEQKMIEVLKVISSSNGKTIILKCKHVSKNRGTRPDLSYLTNTEEKHWNCGKFGTMIINKEFENAHRKISELIQIAEMYNDFLLDKHEEGFGFQIVNKVLNELKREENETK